MSDTWVDPALMRQGVSPRMIDTLRDVARPLRRRKLPSPGSSVMYDECYAAASAKGWIAWKQVDPVYASLVDDHYVLAEPGFAILALQSAACRALADK